VLEVARVEVARAAVAMEGVEEEDMEAVEWVGEARIMEVGM